MDDDVTLRIAEEDELEKLIALWTGVFDAAPEVFTCEYHAFGPEHRVTFVAEVGGQIVSSVQLFDVPIRDEEKDPVTIGGIANVCTRPEYRRKRYASALLKNAIEEMQRREHVWSLLFTGKHSYYEPMGWRTVHRSHLEANIIPSDLPADDIDVKLDTLPDLRRLRSIHDSSFRTPLSQIRSDLDWQFRIPERIKTKAVFMGPDSYAIARLAGGRVVLEEWGMPDRTVEKFQRLILAVARWAVANGAAKLTVSAPIRAEARYAYESFFHNVQYAEETEAMVRPISPEWPMGRILSLFLLPRARFLRMDNF